jgi:hypothetical protein
VSPGERSSHWNGVIQRERRDIGRLTPQAHVAGVAAVVVLIGLVAGPYLEIDGALVRVPRRDDPDRDRGADA